jgi:long-chain acyl-CoA synthetase
VQSWIHVLEWRANTHADLVAVVDDRGQAWTYAELLDRVEHVAGGLTSRDVGPDDIVAVVAQNSAWYLAAALAIGRAGALPLLVNWRLPAPELAELLTLARPSAAIADPGFTGVVEEAISLSGLTLSPKVVLPPPPKTPPGTGDRHGWDQVESLAAPAPERPLERLSSKSAFAILHTSGTTGKAKLIPLDNAGLIRALSGFAIEIGDQVTGSRHLQLMPLFHLAGFSQGVQCFLTAGTLYIPTSFNAADVIDRIERDGVEFFTAAPSIIDMLLDEIAQRVTPPQLSSLKEIQYGSAPIRPELLRRAVTVLNCRFRQIYGNSESQSTVTLLAPEDHQPDNPHLASAGKLALGWEARVVTASGDDVPAGEPGELLIRGESLFAGYWNDPAATEAAFLPGGWYRTGDVVRIDSEGYLWVLDRARDMVISGGENIFPAEVEALLAEHPDVKEAAVIGVPDPRWGEAVHAVVVPAVSDHVDGATLIEWARERLAHFKCPRSITFTDQLPRTTTGKVLKRELREQLASEAASPASL